MVLGSPKLEKHQACYAKTCKELLSVPPCYPVPRTAQPCWGLVDVWSSHYLAVVPSPLMFRLENHPTAEAFLERKPWNKNTGGDVRSVQHTSQTLVTAWWWLEPWNFNEFHILWRIIPTDELIFFRGVETTNQNKFGFLVRNGGGQPLAVLSFKVTVGCLGMRANRKVLPSRCHW
jgi:hypothetical protein